MLCDSLWARDMRNKAKWKEMVEKSRDETSHDNMEKQAKDIPLFTDGSFCSKKSATGLYYYYYYYYKCHLRKRF